MTFAQYIDNPMGKANAVFSARDTYKAQYMEKFDMIYMREAGKIDRKMYYDKSRDVYLVHIKMPSETVKGFYYDVVIRFYTNDNAERANSSLKNYQVQFFSNDPAFIYTYMYVFLKHDMLVKDLTPKCPKASLTQRPEERNAYEVPGYVKSIYFAYILMSRSDMFLKSTYQNFGQRYSKSALLNSVMSGENKMEERKRVEAKQKAQKKNEKSNVSRIAHRYSEAPESNMNKKVKTVGRVGTVNRITPISGKNTKTVNKVNTIGRNSSSSKKKK